MTPERQAQLARIWHHPELRAYTTTNERSARTRRPREPRSRPPPPPSSRVNFDFQLGGPLVAVLGLASVVATAIVAERTWALQRAVSCRRASLRWSARACDGKATKRRSSRIERLSRRVDPRGGAARPRAGSRPDARAMEDRGRRAAELGGAGARRHLDREPATRPPRDHHGHDRDLQQVTAHEASDAMSAGVLATGIWRHSSTAARLCVAIPTFLAHRG